MQQLIDELTALPEEQKTLPVVFLDTEYDEYRTYDGCAVTQGVPMEYGPRGGVRAYGQPHCRP